jgi:uncharacterized protein (DUF2147 family)
MQAAVVGENFMAIRIILMSALLGASFAAPVSLAHAADEATGIWQTQAGDARVKVAHCGAALCGTVVSLRDKLDPATGKPAVDDKNPDPAKRNRSMIGLHIFIDMKPTGPNKWSGQIYNSDDGKTYTSNVSVAGQESLRVEGCVGAFCGGETWTRVGR